MIGVSSPTDAKLQCTFHSDFTDTAHCTVQYGTDPTYMNMPFSAESNDTATAGNFVSVILRERLNSSTSYYYTVSAVRRGVTVTVRGTFTTPAYSMYTCCVLLCTVNYKIVQLPAWYQIGRVFLLDDIIS